MLLTAQLNLNLDHVVPKERERKQMLKSPYQMLGE